MFRQDEVNRGVLLVYKTRNTGHFNFSQLTHDLLDMPHEARIEYAKLLRILANQIEPLENDNA